MSAVAATASSQDSGWGNEVLPGVFLTRRSGSAADAARRTGLGILANTLAHDGSTVDFSKVYDRIKDRRALEGRLAESNRYMIRYLAKEKRRRGRRLAEIAAEDAGEDPQKAAAAFDAEAQKAKEAAKAAAAASRASDDEDDDEDEDEDEDGADDDDLQPITPEEDDRVIEESILENELLLKDIREELAILDEMVSVHKCMQSGNANEKKGGVGGSTAPVRERASSDNESDSDSDSDEEGEEDEEAPYAEDDNAPFEDDVTGMDGLQPAAAGGRFAL